MTRLNILFLLPVTILLVSSSVPPLLPPTVALTARSAAPASAPSFGLNSHLATRYPDAQSMDIPAETVAELGVDWVREDFHWYRIQPEPHVWDWTFPDAAMRALLSRNIQVVGVLGPSVGWATPYQRDIDHDISFYAPDPDHFVEYARRLVTRYRRYIKHWEIWNEPDNPLFWRPQPDPLAYADLLIRTSQAIKEADPEAQVLIGGFNPFDTAFIRQVAARGAWEHFDILAIHPYVDPYSPEEGNITSSLDAMHAMMYQMGDKPIWATELGWSSGPGDRDALGKTDEQMQANFLVRSMLLLWEAGVERSFWYTLKDDPGNPYGLLAYGEGRADFDRRMRKPAFYAFRTLNEQLDGAELVDHRSLFAPTTIEPCNDVTGWLRTNQPNGSLRAGNRGSMLLTYDFTTAGNDYVVFARKQPIPLTDDAHALGAWIYGNGSDHRLAAWVRDAEGELLQFPLGITGEPGWRFIAAPLNITVEPGNRLEGQGNLRVDQPASLVALVVDDSHDRFIGSGTIYIDEIAVVTGREVYDLRLQRGTMSLDVIWSPPGIRVRLNTAGLRGRVVYRDGGSADVMAQDGQLALRVMPNEPIYLWHSR
ncbi:MAG: hypothetical protein HC837_10140 [Chloroflexaceae bacterium]|nr:hypothetical protein [Chloroflexaceae bacterium]